MILNKNGVIESPAEPVKNKRKYWLNTTTNQMNILKNNKYELLNKPIDVVLGVEFKTGKLRNGKEEWCKVISCGALSNAGQTVANIGFSVKNNPIHKMEGIALDSSTGQPMMLPYTNATYINYCVQVDIWYDTNRIAITTKRDLTNFDVVYITLYYTKK